MKKFTLDHLNKCSPQEFVASLGGIFEHSPWVAERAARRPVFQRQRRRENATVKSATATSWACSAPILTLRARAGNLRRIPPPSRALGSPIVRARI
jgi:hypothetical protein